MIKANVPTVPGSDGIVESVEEGLALAQEIGYPVLAKAKAGGGGKGMRIIKEASEFEKNFVSAQTEAAAAFGNGDVYWKSLSLNLVMWKFNCWETEKGR